MRKFKKTLIICLLLPLCACTNKTGKVSKQYSFLENGVDMHAYAICTAQLESKCSKSDRTQQLSCQEQVLAKTKECTQYSKILQAMGMPPTEVTIYKLGALAIVDINFIADGKNWYQIITPHGHIINTQVDPRKLSSIVANKYNKVHFMISNWDKPQYYKANNSITATLEITKDCLACPTIGKALIKFSFTKDSLLQKISLLKFTSLQSAS